MPRDSRGIQCAAAYRSKTHPANCVLLRSRPKELLANPGLKGPQLFTNTLGRLSQRVDDFPIGCFRKRFQRACPDVSQHAQLQVETCRHSIVRSFVDRDDVIVAHGEEKGFELAAHIFESFLRRVQTLWRVLHFQRALVGPICEHDVCGHNRPPSGTRHSWYEAMVSTSVTRNTTPG